MLCTYPDGTTLLKAYTPDKISHIATLPDRRRIFMGVAPELSLVSRIYGAVDPLTITSALRTFLSEREAEIAHIEAEDERKRREADRQFRLENAITWEEYQREKETMQQKDGISAGEG